MATTMLIYDDSSHTRQHQERLSAEVKNTLDVTRVCFVSAAEELIVASEQGVEILLMLLAKLEVTHIKVIRALQESRPCPLIVFAGDADPRLIKQLIDCGVSVVIHGVFDAARLPTLCAIANARFVAHRKLYDELQEARSRLADRKLLDRAKGLLMAHRKLSEPEAYALLRKQAMDKGLRLGVVAQQVIDTLELLELAVAEPKAFEHRKVSHLANGKPANC